MKSLCVNIERSSLAAYKTLHLPAWTVRAAMTVDTSICRQSKRRQKIKGAWRQSQRRRLKGSMDGRG